MATFCQTAIVDYKLQRSSWSACVHHRICCAAWHLDVSIRWRYFKLRLSSRLSTLQSASATGDVRKHLHECTLSVIAYYTQPGVRILHLFKTNRPGFCWYKVIRQRVCFFLLLCLLALYQHNQCKFVLKSR
jgi:hypothetical protein